MKAVGVIVEYNPFHNGHAFHIQKAKEISKADIVIAVMSGNFLQRGEPALVSKWYRTKMALLGGVDLVFELPYMFATQKAETFANGAISLLEATGCESVCFGSESGDIDAFVKTVKAIEGSQSLLDEQMKQQVKTGVSYPKALSLTYDKLLQPDEHVNLTTPNNILGFQYIRAIRNQKSSMVPLTIARKNAGYHDEHFSSETIASATSIRKSLFSSEANSLIDSFIPPSTNTILKEYLQLYGQFHHWENYWPFLQFRLLQTQPSALREIYEIEEGIENRIIRTAMKANSFHEFMESVKTKRYTWTRLQRISTHILNNATKAEMGKSGEKASYLRLLGMSRQGKTYLNQQKSHFSLPVISKLSAYQEDDILIDIRAARIYSSILPAQSKKKLLQQEFTSPPIYLD